MNGDFAVVYLLIGGLEIKQFTLLLIVSSVNIKVVYYMMII